MPERGSVAQRFIQVTWRSNYLAFGQWLGVDDLFVRKPHLLERDDYAWLGPVWHWTTRGLNTHADRRDFDGITAASMAATTG